MAEKISWTLSVQVEGGPSVSGANVIEVEAYGKLSVTIPAKVGDTAGTARVEVQPGSPAQVDLLLITSSVYSEELTYTLNGDSIKLDALQLWMGKGAVGLLGADLKTFTFSNGSDKPAVVTILVGRDATPPPPPP